MKSKIFEPAVYAKAFIALGMSAGLFFSSQANAGSRTGFPEEGEPASKAKAKTAKGMSSRNNSAVKIYPDILTRDMHVIAKDKLAKELDFFVFDLQGTLVQNFKMKQKDHIKISGLARGKYIYRVFSGDTETAAGQFEIR
jgi:hypothetical protein